MLEIVGFDLEEAKNRHDFADRHSGFGLQKVEQAWNVLLHVQVYLDVLELVAARLPDVVQAVACDLLELVQLVDECVQVADALVEEFFLLVACVVRVN